MLAAPKGKNLAGDLYTGYQAIKDIRISKISAGYHSCNERISREYRPHFNKISYRFQPKISAGYLNIR